LAPVVREVVKYPQPRGRKIGRERMAPTTSAREEVKRNIGIALHRQKLS